MNLIGSPTVFYSPIENSRKCVTLKAVNFLDYCLESAQHCRFWTAILYSFY